MVVVGFSQVSGVCMYVYFNSCACGLWVYVKESVPTTHVHEEAQEAGVLRRVIVPVVFTNLYEHGGEIGQGPTTTCDRSKQASHTHARMQIYINTM